MKKSDCQLENPNTNNSCCCNCKWRLRIMDHSQFQNDIQLGWGCAGFAFMEGEDVVYSGDFEHGLCELHIHK